MTESSGEHAIRAHAEIRIWGETVGAIVELADGRVVFEYAQGFRKSGIEISPIHLPLSIAGPQTFPELRRKSAFDGLPGVLADSLPDAFGNQVMRAYFAAKGQDEKSFSPVQRLLYVGEGAIGALTFHPSEEWKARRAERESLEIAKLVRDARRIVEGKPDVAIPEIYRIGASAGGMRPKAIVLYDEKSGVVRSGHGKPNAHETPCILKFDGVGDGSPNAAGRSLRRPLPFNRIEAAYSEMARAAGIETSRIRILEHDGYAHLLIDRFDLDAASGERIHQHTLGGMIHVDYNEPGASSYEEYLRVVMRLGMAYASLEQAYRRIVFNVLAVNQDDHVKNLSFHLPRGGAWQLSPAYDVTFARGRGFTANHQMSVNGKVTDISTDDLLAVAAKFDIDHPQRILEQTRSAVADFRAYAKETKVPKAAMDAVAAALL